MSLFDDHARHELLAAAAAAELTRTHTAVDLAAASLPAAIPRSAAQKPRQALDDYLVALQQLPGTEDSRAVLGRFLDTLQSMTSDEGFRELARVRAAHLGEHSRSTAPVDHTRQFPEKILFRDETLPVSYLEMGARAARSVGKLVVPIFLGGVEQQDQYRGTAWLLTQQHIVTCVHVVRGRDGGVPTDADLTRQIEASTFELGAPPHATVNRQVCLWPDLDVAILELAAPAQVESLVCRAAKLERPTANSGFYVNVIQHPRGEDKRVGLRANAALDVTDRDLYYFTDTEKGASGAPCFDDRWLVVGVHRAFELRTGLRYLGRTAGHVNVGTRISEVLARLRGDPALASLVAQIRTA